MPSKKKVIVDVLAQGTLALGSVEAKKEASKPTELLTFSRLVSAAGTIMRFKSGGVGAPSPIQKKAFASVSTPETVTALAVIESMNLVKKLKDLEPRYSRYDHDEKKPDPMWSFTDKRGVFAGLFSSLDKADWEGMTAAISELADDIDAATKSDAFKSSAREGARLVVHPASPTQLNFPSLGMALAGSGTMVGAKKTKSLAGFLLPRSGLVDGDMAREQGADVIGWMNHNWEAERAGLDPHEEAEWSAARDQINAFPPAPRNHGNHVIGMQEGSFERFIAGGDDLGAVLLGGDIPLPNARLIKAVSRNGLSNTSPLSLILSSSPSTASRLVTHASLGPKADRAKLASARFVEMAIAPWGKALSSALAEESPLAMGLPGLSLRGPSLSALARGDWAADEAEAGGQSPHAISAKKAVKEWKGKLTKSEALVAAEIGAIFNNENYGHSQLAGWQTIVAQAMGCQALRVKGWNLAESMLGVHAKDLSKKFSARPARVGLLQVASVLSLASLTQKKMAELNQAPNWYNREPVPLPPSDADHLTVLPALEKLDVALAKAREAYADAVFDQAAKVEDQWMQQAGFGPAWRQSLSMGEPSTRSIAWSMLNPMSDAMSSSDPVERLAGASARGFGLSSKLGSAQVAQDYKEALAMRGASPEGVELLAASSEGRDVFEALAQGLVLPQKSMNYACAQALEFACQALSACAKQGLSPDQTGTFLKSYAGLTGSGGRLARLYLVGYGSREGTFDGLGPALGQVPVGTYENAQVLRALGQAKSKGYASFVFSMVEDWAQTLSEAGRLGLNEEEATRLARERSDEIRSAMPTTARIDWRSEVAGQPAWKLFGIPSPRLSAALLDAQARGGELGSWAGQRARSWGIDDARDGNDVVAQIRDMAKAHAGMGDAAWRLAIKDPSSLELLDKAMDDFIENRNPCYCGPKLPEEIESAFTFMVSPLKNSRSDDVAIAGRAPLFGLALSTAAANGINPQDAAVVGKALMVEAKEANLFGMEIQPQMCQGALGAEAYCQETLAKRERLPKIFIEACRRYQKLKSDYEKPPTIGPDGVTIDKLDPKHALDDEVTDLVDWISGSEQGIWVQLPKEPTWGQLRRFSKSWHDEQALVAMEKASRQKLSQELAQAKFDEAAGANPFMVKNTSRWAKLLGTYASDGWEAVELQSSSDLTEEGAAMHHCVSSYSGVCREGKSRIFSVRLNGERVSTLEVKGNRGLSEIDPTTQFSIHQNKGSYNNPPSKQCRDFCEEVLAKIAASWPKQTQAIERKLEVRKEELRGIAAQRRADLNKSLKSARPKAGTLK